MSERRILAGEERSVERHWDGREEGGCSGQSLAAAQSGYTVSREHEADVASKIRVSLRILYS